MTAHLIFDADDTLWESNRLFNVATEQFIDWMTRFGVDPDHVLGVFNEVEKLNTPRLGSGLRAFRRTLYDTFQRVMGRDPDGDEMQAISSLTSPILSSKRRLMPGATETLADLASRHDILLLTKGSPDEQEPKIDASGIASWFRRIFIVADKTPATYRQVVREAGITPARTWMIGNSPRSDIIPALEAGLGAIYIPNADTWTLELEALPHDDQRLIHLDKLTELVDYF